MFGSLGFAVQGDAIFFRAGIFKLSDDDDDDDEEEEEERLPLVGICDYCQESKPTTLSFVWNSHSVSHTVDWDHYIKTVIYDIGATFNSQSQRIMVYYLCLQIMLFRGLGWSTEAEEEQLLQYQGRQYTSLNQALAQGYEPIE